MDLTITPADEDKVRMVEGVDMEAYLIELEGLDMFEVSGEYLGKPFIGFLDNSTYNFLVVTPFVEMLGGETSGDILKPFRDLQVWIRNLTIP